MRIKMITLNLVSARKYTSHVLVKWFLCLCLVSAVESAVGQISNVLYGKNRVQYHKHFSKWYLYESDHIITHWYGNSRMIGEFASHMGEHEFNSLQNILEHHINDKVQLLVYTDATDMKQSNIGLEDAFVNQKDEVKVSGSKVFVFFDGDYTDLRRQIREGIAAVYLRDMLQGGNIQQVVQNAIAQELPTWFTQGLISYAGVSWDHHHEQNTIQLLQSRRGKYEDFDDLAREDPSTMGHVLWHHIATEYGVSAVSNILYVSRLSHNLNQNFNYVIDESLDQIKLEVLDNIQNRYEPIISAIDTIRTEKVKQRKHAEVTKTKWSPNGKELIYITNEIGRSRIYSYNKITGKTKKIMATGSRNNIQAADEQYPLVCFTDNSRFLYIIYERRDVVYIRKYDRREGGFIEQEVDTRFQRIYGMDAIKEDQLVFSALVDQVTDLWKYNARTRGTARITDDYHLDVDPHIGILNDIPGIFWSTNRSSPILRREEYNVDLPIEHTDIYFLPLEEKRTAIRLSSTPDYSERSPISTGNRTIQYLSDQSGLSLPYSAQYQRAFTGNDTLVEMASGKHYLLSEIKNTSDTSFIQRQYIEPRYTWIPTVTSISSHGSPVVDHDLYLDEDRINRAEVIYSEGRRTISIHPWNSSLWSPEDRWYKNKGATQKSKLVNKNIIRNPTDSFDINIPEKYLFISQFDDPPVYKDEIDAGISEDQSTGTSDTLRLKNTEIKPIVFSQILSSRRRFRIADMDIRFDNEVLFDGLQNFTFNENDLNNQPFGILAELKITDLFEDWHAQAGVRFPTQFNGSEYFLVLDDNRNRIDKRYAVYRKAQTDFLGITPFNAEIKEKRITYLAMARFSYPFDIYRSLRLTTSFRMDDVFFLVSENNTTINTLNASRDRTQRLGLRLEYIFDNTLQIDQNILHGTRYKFYGEAMNRMELDLGDNWRFKPGKGVLGVVGIDARHYQRLDRRSVFAARIAGAKSWGAEEILYVLGGVDNWIAPSRNSIIPIAPGNYAFQNLAVQMRGFRQNIRNGNSFMVSNFELRVPVFQYFKKDRLRSGFFRNFMLTTFFDAGTAWSGLTPWSGNNPLNNITVSNSSTTIRARYFRDNLVYGYGFGARIPLLGYMLRVDYGWGVDSGSRGDGRLYISLGTDF